MERWQKVLEAARKNPANVRFADLVTLVLAMGYTLRRQRGSHQIYARHDAPMVNLQEEKGKAKSYQVKQVLGIFDTLNAEVK